ncbi:MAG: hypothetical protein ACI8PT_002611 [Gammaproteobacteria bacterium]|jgi:hypothetical protein
MPTEFALRITHREPFAEGETFAQYGPFECISGQLKVSFDPDSAAYAGVVDLEFAARDAQGQVSYETDFYLIAPIDSSRGNRRLLFDVVNRGNKKALQFFNGGPGENTPTSSRDAGNGFLFRQGYSVLWCGWQGDLAPGNGRTTLRVPVATDGERGIIGEVCEEIIVGAQGVRSLPISGNTHTHSHRAASLDTSAAVLTCRRIQADPPQTVPPTKWQFASLDATGKPIPSDTDVYLASGFQPGWIYELRYVAKQPSLLGLGFAAVRDTVDFFRHAKVDSTGVGNPLCDGTQAPWIEKSYAWGRSQSGRYLREFVYRGWNVGSERRRVFEAVWPHVTGAGRLALNLRFAHPDRFPRQHEAHFYPSDQFPFAYTQTVDPSSGKSDAILRSPGSDPLVLHTQTSSEYWQRRGSLVHTDAYGVDLPEHPNVRMYLFASSQHHAAPGVPAQPGPHQHPSNPLDTSPLLRGLLVRLDRWASGADLPPPSAVPRLANGTLAHVTTVHDAFPQLGVTRPPRQPNRLFPHDFGPNYAHGVVSNHPPLLDATNEYAVLVPSIDADGNELVGLRTPDLTAPKATYTGWNFHIDGPGAEAMYSILGSYLPFAKTPVERATNDDSRRSLAERYPTPAAYVRQVVLATESLLNQGILLDEDAERYVDRAITDSSTDSDST